jgi:hypothetical protein
MTRRDFIVIAAALYAAQPVEPPAPTDSSTRRIYLERREVWARCVDRVADGIARTSPTFDRARFLNACTKGA